MTKSADKPPKPKNLLSGQNVFFAGIGWAVVALLFFLLFSDTAPGEDTPLWYSIGTYILEAGAFLGAALLCYRNWLNPQIASGRNVWLGVGLGMFCFFIGDLVFGVWELYFKLDPDVSPADLFYMAFYVFLGWGMILAVMPRRLNLEVWQWITVAVIAIAGIAFALLVALNDPASSESVEVATPEPTEQVSPQPSPEQSSPGSPSPAAEPEPEKELPEWVAGTDRFLNQFARPVSFFYIIADVGLLVIATTLLLAFWGGRFSQSWRMIAFATGFLYCADMWFKYAATLPTEYESGGLLEVFFVFSGTLFAIGAALEYDVSSSRSSRSRRRRGGG